MIKNDQIYQSQLVHDFGQLYVSFGKKWKKKQPEWSAMRLLYGLSEWHTELYSQSMNNEHSHTIHVWYIHLHVGFNLLAKGR